LFLVFAREGKSAHEFVNHSKRMGAQCHPCVVHRYALAQSVCQQPVNCRDSIAGELDARRLRAVGRGGAAFGEDVLDMD
jgi:hypothetical protein